MKNRDYSVDNTLIISYPFVNDKGIVECKVISAIMNKVNLLFLFWTDMS